MKRLLLFAVALLLLSIGHIWGQGIIIHFKDGSQIAYATSGIEKITMLPSEEGYLEGKWHLGYWVGGGGARVIHFDGKEYVEFIGTHFTWGGAQHGSNSYTIKYSADNKSFTATNLANSSDVSKWEILEYSEKMLVLRKGSDDRYFYTSEQAAKDATLTIAPPNHAETTDINTIKSYATGLTKTSSTPMGSHYANRHVTTDADKAWLLDPKNEPDILSSANLTQWLEKPVNLYPFGDPVPADINQHAIGDCCACAVFASFAYIFPDFIKTIITDNGDNTYTVKMYDPQGKSVDVCVSNKILCDASGKIGQVTSKNNIVAWPTILEKAFMKWEAIYKVSPIEGIDIPLIAPLFTGDGESFIISPNSLHTSELKLLVEWALDQGLISVGGFTQGGLQCGQLQTISGHAFTVMRSTLESSIFAMRNPWGVEPVDGILEIPDDRSIVQTIDIKFVNPGAAAPYVRKNIPPYTPPAYTINARPIGVSDRLMQRALNTNFSVELW